MKNGKNGTRMSRREMERRRKNRLKRKIFHLSLVLVIILLLLCIGNIYARLGELQTALRHLEEQTNGTEAVYTQGKVAKENSSGAGYADRVLSVVVGRGDFTAQGHYIVIYGYESDGFLVNDPNCVARSRKWAFSELKSQIKNIWAYLPAGQSVTEISQVI